MRKGLVAVVVLAFALGCDDDREAQYRTRAELDAAGAGARSWFPEWLPSNALGLREAHNLDTNSTVGRFTATRAFQPPPQLCKRSHFGENPGMATWWPDDKLFQRLEHFACVEPMTFGDGRVAEWSLGVAIDRSNGDVFFWRKRG